MLAIEQCDGLAAFNVSMAALFGLMAIVFCGHWTWLRRRRYGEAYPLSKVFFEFGGQGTELGIVWIVLLAAFGVLVVAARSDCIVFVVP